MYSGAVSRTGFFTLTPSAQRYSYCKRKVVVMVEANAGEARVRSKKSVRKDDDTEAQINMGQTFGPADMIGQELAVQHSSKVLYNTEIAL